MAFVCCYFSFWSAKYFTPQTFCREHRKNAFFYFGAAVHTHTKRCHLSPKHCALREKFMYIKGRLFFFPPEALKIYTACDQKCGEYLTPSLYSCKSSPLSVAGVSPNKEHSVWSQTEAVPSSGAAAKRAPSEPLGFACVPSWSK